MESHRIHSMYASTADRRRDKPRVPATGPVPRDARRVTDRVRPRGEGWRNPSVYGVPAGTGSVSPPGPPGCRAALSYPPTHPAVFPRPAAELIPMCPNKGGPRMPTPPTNPSGAGRSKVPHDSSNTQGGNRGVYAWCW